MVVFRAVRPVVWRIVLLFELDGPRLGPVDLEQHVVADAVDERAEALGRGQPFSLPEGDQDAHEGFLLRVFDEGRRTQPRSQLQRKQIAKVFREMVLGVWMPGNQAIHIRAIEIAPDQRCHSCQFYPTQT